jgi:hypothetical protein
MSDSVRVNGNALSWASCGFKIDSDRYYGIKSISFDEALESVLVHGMGKHYAPRARTRGKYVPGVLKITAEVNTIKTVQQALAARAADQRSYGTVEFEVFLEAVEAEQTYTAEFLRCRWAKNTASFEESPEAAYQEAELSVMQIIQNGLSLFDATEGNVP